MDLAKLLGVNVNVEEIEKRALEAKMNQEEMLKVLREINTKLDVIVKTAQQYIFLYSSSPRS